MVDFEALLIGGSAGSLKPLMTIASALPSDFSASVFIAQHADPRSQRLLANLLQQLCKLPVIYPLNEEHYMPGKVYVAPPGHHLLITDKKIWIFPANFLFLNKPNIDLMMQSATYDFGDREIGVILSGMGSDGVIGIKAVKQKGGLVAVQSEDSAQEKSMPEAAIATGLADYVLPPQELIETIVKVITGGNNT